MVQQQLLGLLLGAAQLGVATGGASSEGPWPTCAAAGVYANSSRAAAAAGRHAVCAHGAAGTLIPANFQQVSELLDALDEPAKKGRARRAQNGSSSAPPTYTLLQFARKDCPFSKEAEPLYRALAASLPHICSYKIVGQDGPGYDPTPRLNSRFGVRGFPSLVLLQDGVMHTNLYERELAKLAKQVANLTRESPPPVPLQPPPEQQQQTGKLWVPLVGRLLDPPAAEHRAGDSVLWA
eukprot:SAG22_NODE_482_length_9931_cov_9.247254_8_plen_236_part_01